ncbi:Lipopolysaccharide-modifying protein [Macrophomina phaseolina MS6]|uniref:Lipopolysaccharide-modifying protein n=1 Tax=Macrophomina phaseolina (strain MS6) TaxID=1126212 RepID=K2RY41_MACPH|nr:Lipopolysaccharide-modifying protein [Macrophomina phaseolina MS6]
MLVQSVHAWWSATRRLVFAVFSVLLALSLVYLWFDSDSTAGVVPSYGFREHAIDDLVNTAHARFNDVLAQRSNTLKQAAARYRHRRGRHPPPGFDAWFEYAQARDAVIVEDFFDRIYEDLEPFWGIPARDIRVAAATFEPTVVSVRGGAVQRRTDHDRIWMDLWTDLVGTIAQSQKLPDLDMPINIMDESRLLVPWEDIDRLMAISAEGRSMPAPSAVSSQFTGLQDLEGAEGTPTEWIREEPLVWPLVSAACPPDSPTRAQPNGLDRTKPASDYMPTHFPDGSHSGYVSNWTAATDVCSQPHLRGLHGSFIEPQSVSIATRLIPMFGGSKLSVNNEILLPPAMYWSDNEMYSGGEQHGEEWAKKINRVVWRGAATGGRNRADTWPYFQRHRFISMVNGTKVAEAEKNGGVSTTFRLPSPGLFHVEAAEQSRLGAWIDQFSDAGFTDLLCFPHEDGPRCSYTNHEYQVAQGLPMKLQYDYKYLPDIDGNSFSGRYRGFLRSSSLPIKATVYREWHDSRLFAWVHFVPMDNTFIDFYGIMEYFLGSYTHKRKPHDQVAQMIAEHGQEWAEKVLRKEDMQIYVYRLLLEYARVCDDKRASLGFVDDL